ncbi:hypothetical protein AM500_13520 [Bacillus sp. FJAT-18017]|nr:hypothetical protein AM500_13520 [Bacillus sp. FJAT-18017]
MSLEHTEIMLKTLEQFQESRIKLTFSNDEGLPLFVVTLINRQFQITNLSTNTTNHYNDLASTLLAIKKALKFLQ